MAHKTFISYKYSESRDLRDKIIESLGDDAVYYKGEDGYSDDMSSLAADTIKERLADMMFDTSVTIVILSPKMKDSKWIEWELSYCLKDITRKGRTSHLNGIVGVVQKVNSTCDWIKEYSFNCHGSLVYKDRSEYLPTIIKDNRFNSDPPSIHCDQCRTFDTLWGSYISFIDEDLFLSNPSFYIDNAYNKSENDGSGFIISKE